MNVQELLGIIGADYYVGVPDSQLKALCDYLMATYGIDPRHHLIGANEGNCVALAAGYHLATGRLPVVYMQNSGEGNVVNPVASLLHEKVYAIPLLFLIGWRGEPGVHDEPQHVFQGEITLPLLKDLGVDSFVIREQTAPEEVAVAMDAFRKKLAAGERAAFVIGKNALSYEGQATYGNSYPMKREQIIRHVVEAAGEDPILSTTGKASRELFEIREANGQGHERDFLTVGSMGHVSSLALGVAIQTPHRRIWCLDGDGAVLMHMGALALIGRVRPENLVHVVINNGAHETVGGQPTAADGLNLWEVAKACGYPHAVAVERPEELIFELEQAKNRRQLSFIEVKCALGARKDLGRPTTAAIENRKRFMAYLQSL